MSQKVQRHPSNAPESYGERKETPTVTLEFDGGDTFEAVFATDDAANSFIQALNQSNRRFLVVTDEDGKRKWINPDFLKSAEITGVANPPAEAAPRTAVMGEVVPFNEAGGNLKSARWGEGNTAQVVFADGTTYEYSDVDNAAFTEFINAKQPGKFYDRSVRGKYAERLVP